MVIREEGPETKSSKWSWNSGAWGRESELGSNKAKSMYSPCKNLQCFFPEPFRSQVVWLRQIFDVSGQMMQKDRTNEKAGRCWEQPESDGYTWPQRRIVVRSVVWQPTAQP